jgi:23S rRNA (cytidine1920-2'-O)/16S rRNA (cytidine1409-2'-O)-methyltransferase
VREPKVHKEVIEKTVDLAEENGLTVSGLSYSPVKGPEGNIEYLIHVLKSAEPKPFDKAEIDAVVEAAHNALD